MYPTRTKRDIVRIPLYCYHECTYSCRFDFNFENSRVNIYQNNSFNHQTMRCELSNKVVPTNVNISSYDVWFPMGRNGALYNPDTIIINDLEFDIELIYPLENPATIPVKVDQPVSTRVLLSLIYNIYNDVYKEEEKTATPHEMKIESICDECVNKNALDHVQNHQILQDVPTDIDCCICFSPLCEKDTIKLDCNHMFHKDCTVKWSNTGDSCPICRNPFVMCSRCNNTRVVISSEMFSVIPSEYRESFFRNRTDGVFGIHTCDADMLTIVELWYNRHTKVLLVKASCS